MNLQPIFQTRDFAGVMAFPQVTFTVTRYSFAAVGGPDQATLAAGGQADALWELLNWLRAPVELVDDEGTARWWGYVHEVIVQVGRVQIGVSLDTLYNRVNVVYSYVEPGTNAVGTRANTGWAQYDDSVSEYGTRELLHSLSGDTPTSATAARDTALAMMQLPRPVLTPSYAQGEASATLTLRGWWYTLEWTYFARTAGIESHTTGGTAQTLGLGFTGTTVAFEAATKYISDLNAQLGAFVAGTVLAVTGSASNNGSYTVDQGTTQVQETYTATTISFDVTGTTYKIADSAKGLGVLAAHDVIQITGSSANNGYYRVTSVAGDGSEAFFAQAVVDESAGASVTLTIGHHVRVTATLVDEMPGASVTITAVGMQAAQSFQLGSSEVWNAYSIKILAAKVGTPTDNLTVELCANGGGAPGAVLASGTITGSTLTTNREWATATLSSYVALALSTTYWVVVRRSGSNDPTNYYTVGVDESLGYPRGTLLLWTGAAWVARTPDADMAFQVTGVEETTVQITRIENDEGQFFAGTLIDDASGLYTSPYRDGDGTALAEIAALLKRGTTNDRRLLATVTRDRYLEVYEEPELSTSTIELLMGSDGMLRLPLAGTLDGAVAPVGKWCQFVDMPTTVDMSLLADPAFFFVELAEYDPVAQMWLVTPRGAPSPWELSAIVDG